MRNENKRRTFLCVLYFKTSKIKNIDTLGADLNRGLFDLCTQACQLAMTRTWVHSRRHDGIIKIRLVIAFLNVIMVVRFRQIRKM
jgi:hypothetical protein